MPAHRDTDAPGGCVGGKRGAPQVSSTKSDPAPSPPGASRPGPAPVEQLLDDRILVLDGAMGTMIQRFDLGEDDFRGDLFRAHPTPLLGNNDLLSLTRPDLIGEIHRAYLEAGADIIETNTFSSTQLPMSDYGVEDAVGEINLAAARIAREAADEYAARTPAGPASWPASWAP